MSWDDLRGHGAQLDQLLASAGEGGRLGHALLLLGPEGVGKFTLLEALARGLLCEAGPGRACRTCPACRRVEAGSHPDLLRVDPVGEGFHELTIHFIAERENRPAGAFRGTSVEEFLRLVAGEGGRRIVLLRDVHRMNEETQNAFLKTLEEPGRGVLLAMETSRPSALLPTIRSRVVEITLGGLSDGDTREVLSSVDSRLAGDGALLRLAGGAPGRAVRLAEQGALALLDLLEEAFAGRGHATEHLAGILASEGSFSGATDRQRERERARLVADLALECVRDLQRVSHGADPQGLVHGARVGVAASPSVCRHHLDVWSEARADLELNLAPAAVLERALDRTLHPGRAPVHSRA